jgi:large subunit ribosomal protein L22
LDIDWVNSPQLVHLEVTEESLHVKYQRHKNMEIKAKTKAVRIAPRKIRLIADAIRNKSLDQALTILAVSGKRAGEALGKTLSSAIANAAHNAKVEKSALSIKTILVTEGPVVKRFRPSTRGRVHPYKKRSSHITILLEAKGGVN